MLEQNGVTVEPVTSVVAASEALRSGDEATTVVVANPRNLGTAAARTLAQASLGVDRLVVLSKPLKMKDIQSVVEQLVPLH